LHGKEEITSRTVLTYGVRKDSQHLHLSRRDKCRCDSSRHTKTVAVSNRFGFVQYDSHFTPNHSIVTILLPLVHTAAVRRATLISIIY
jgi:hypothetical protein